ncbi:MAG: succinate--CoA ligase subunit beta [Candidatus Nanohaloarchaeota archaeon QJJ-5]|nr:succinate--CoA ligase subunit beta [Candidatus Nanohaloarchaeota archaeon QJJ-5]
MDLLEWQGRGLFEQYDIPVPAGTVLSETDELRLPDAASFVVKAQVPAGKRKKHGGIVMAGPDEVDDVIGSMFEKTVAGHPVETVMVEEELSIADEFYLSLSINRAHEDYRLVFSHQGGSGVESVAAADDDAITVIELYEYDKEKIREALPERDINEDLLALTEKMYTLMREEDAVLVEINPVIETTDGRLVASDAKVRLDDAAMYRHDRSFDTEQDDALEFVPLDGSIGIIGNGAGLVMATLDTINAYGGAPANFLDIGGGASVEKMTEAMRVAVTEQDVDGLFVNIFGGITRCDLVAEGILDFVEEYEPGIPMVVRMVGTNQTEGRQMLEDHGIDALDSMEACAERICELVADD